MKESVDRRLDDKATEGEIAQMRSVVGSLAWIARKVRPRISYECNKMQSVVASALVKHLDACNRVLQETQCTSDEGLFFKAGAFDFNDAILVTISDASWAGETLIIDDKIFPRRSQHGYFIALGEPKLWDQDEGYLHILGWKSGILRRTCRSTFRAESQGMILATETTTRVRKALADMACLIKRKDPDWEDHIRATRRNVWFTDCQSLHDYLVNSNRQKGA